jgi:hypothetical protein
MTKIIVSGEIQAKLSSLKETAIVCDESGRDLGYFHPIVSSDEYDLTCPFSDEEIRERLSKQRTGRPLRDILADLEKL